MTTTKVTAKELATTIPGIVARIIETIELSGSNDRLDRQNIAVLESLQYRASGEYSIDIRVTTKYGDYAAHYATSVLDELEIPLDSDGLPTGYVEILNRNHFRLTW